MIMVMTQHVLPRKDDPPKVFRLMHILMTKAVCFTVCWKMQC